MEIEKKSGERVGSKGFRYKDCRDQPKCPNHLEAVIQTLNILRDGRWKRDSIIRSIAQQNNVSYNWLINESRIAKDGLFVAWVDSHTKDSPKLQREADINELKEDF